MAALDRAPGVELLGAVRRLFFRMPADGGRIEQHGGALERREPGALGVPLIPAHQGSNPSHPRVERAEAKIPRREVELLVVRGIVGDVHFAVDPREASVGVDHGGAVVIQSRRAPLEHGCDDDHLGALRCPRESLRARPRHGLGQVERRGVLALGEVARAEQLRQASELRAGGRRLRDLRDRGLQVRIRVGRHRHLDEPNLESHGWNLHRGATRG